MIFGDVDDIKLGFDDVSAVYYGGERIWPVETPEPEKGKLTGVKDYLGNSIAFSNSKDYDIWEHNCSVPVFVQTEGTVGEITAYVKDCGADKRNWDLFSVTKKEDNLFVIQDTDPNNNNTENYGTIVFVADGQEYELNVRKRTELLNQEFYYTDKGNCVDFVEIPADGCTRDIEMFRGPANKQSSPLDDASGSSKSHLPVQNVGMVAKVYAYNDGVVTLVNSDREYKYWTECEGMPYDTSGAMTITNMRMEYLNVKSTITFAKNNSGKSRLFYYEVYGTGMKDSATIVFYQKSK